MNSETNTEQSEGWVAAALWDLMDATEDSSTSEEFGLPSHTDKLNDINVWVVEYDIILKLFFVE